MAGATGITVVLFLQFGFFWAFLGGLPVILIAFLLSFVKIHGRPFIGVMSSAFFYITKSKLYLWKKTPKKKESKDQNANTGGEQASQPVPMGLTQSNLKKLAWSLDTNNMFDKEKK